MFCFVLFFYMQGHKPDMWLDQGAQTDGPKNKCM